MNGSCTCEENVEEILDDDTLNIQKTLFQMPAIKKSLRSFDSNAVLLEKIEALENENKRLNATLQKESRLRQVFMEDAKRKIEQTEKIMDQKLTKLQQQADQSVQQVMTINKNLTDTLCDKEACLKKMNEIAAKLKIEQDKEKCKCKFANNVCQKLQKRNEELEKERDTILQDIQRIKADNESLKNDLTKYTKQIDGLNDVI